MTQVYRALRCPCPRTQCRESAEPKTTKVVKRHLRSLSLEAAPCPCSSCNGNFLKSAEAIVAHLLTHGPSVVYEIPSPLDSQIVLPPADPAENPVDDPFEVPVEVPVEVLHRSKCRMAVQHLCKQLIDDVAHGATSQTAAVRFLQYARTHLKDVVSPDLIDSLPQTVYSMKKIAGVEETESTIRHFCPNGCRMFANDDGPQEECGLCTTGWRYDDFGRPTCECVYFSLDDWCSRMLKISEVAEAIDEHTRNCVARPAGIYRDSCDGSIIRSLKERFAESGPDFWCFEQCNDGVIKYVAAQKSMTPVVFHCHALPPWLRTSFGATFFAAAFPSTAKLTQVCTNKNAINTINTQTHTHTHTHTHSHSLS